MVTRIVNVGIRSDQRDEVISITRKNIPGRFKSINEFVQEAVDLYIKKSLLPKKNRDEKLNEVFRKIEKLIERMLEARLEDKVIFHTEFDSRIETLLLEIAMFHRRVSSSSRSMKLIYATRIKSSLKFLPDGIKPHILFERELKEPKLLDQYINEVEALKKEFIKAIKSSM